MESHPVPSWSLSPSLVVSILEQGFFVFHPPWKWENIGFLDEEDMFAIVANASDTNVLSFTSNDKIMNCLMKKIESHVKTILR